MKGGGEDYLNPQLLIQSTFVANFHYPDVPLEIKKKVFILLYFDRNLQLPSDSILSHYIKIANNH